MGSKKKKKENSSYPEDERMPNLDKKYEDIPLAKNDPVMKASSDIQRAHTLGLLGVILGFIIPFVGLFLGIFGFLRAKGVTDVPYDMKRRHASAKAICKAAIAVSLVMMAAMVFLLSTGALSNLTNG